VGLGAATVGVVAVMRLLLAQYRDASEIKPTQPKTQYITQETEDSLKLDTLDSLLRHYNYAIRETAAKIVCDRAVNDGSTVDVLLWGITRPEYEERMKNLRALVMIVDQHTLHLLNSPRSYSAFVGSLERCVEEAKYEKLDDKNFDEYYLRDMAEKTCLMFILQLLNKYDAKALIKAKFIEKWLARQNWGDTDEERQRNFSEYMQKPNRVTEICLRLQESKLGRETLEKVKLVPEGSARPEGPVESHCRIDGSINENAEDQDESRPAEGLQPRILEQSLEEQRLRRQHRHAMVLNNGTRPFSRADIIEHDHD